MMINSKGSISLALLFSLIVLSITLATLALHNDLLNVQTLRQKRYYQLNNIYQQSLLQWHKLLKELSNINGKKKDDWSMKLKEIKNQFPNTVHIPLATVSCQETALTKIHLQSLDHPLHSTLTLFTTFGSFDLTEIPLVLNPETKDDISFSLEKIKVKPHSLPVITPSTVENLISNFISTKLYSFSWLAIRKALNLPLSNDPLPKGIYFIQENEDLQLIFIQSEHSVLEFFSSDNQQNILITLDDQNCHQLIWLISAESTTLIYRNNSWKMTKGRPLLIFNGSIEITKLNLLKEFQAVITAFNQIVINLKETSLTAETGRLLLICRPLNPFSGKSGPGEIILKNREKLTLNLNLFAGGKFENHSQELNLNGSLQASQIESELPLTIKPAKFAQCYFQLTDIFLIKYYSLNFLWED